MEQIRWLEMIIDVEANHKKILMRESNRSRLKKMITSLRGLILAN